MKYISLIFLLLSFCAFPAFAQDVAENPQPFSAWLDDFKKDAAGQGISSATLDDAFANTQPLDKVIELDRKQPESKLTLAEYLHNTVTDKRVEEGKDALDDNRELLSKIGKEYGVQPRFIVALWGIETNYGDNTGGFSIIDALATLAYDGRRSEFFRGELIKALEILQEEHMPAAELEGSWAGALGQCQFMPSSFLKFAVDYDKDGKRDIWNSNADVFASIANYLQSLGWDDKRGWGIKVTLPEGFDSALADIAQEKTFKEWQTLGVRRADGSDLPGKDNNVSLIMVGEGDDAVSYLVTENYKALLKWNRSRFFATAVGTLADRIDE